MRGFDIHATMPRRARLDAPGVLHHVIIRGIERRRIFRTNKDREDFLARLEDLIPDTRACCYAWALMPNHAHFLLRTGTVPLATLMRKLLTGYAVSFNRRYRRHGPLFQNRYKSIVCQEDAYFSELVRYIHLNPVRAGMVGTLSELNGYPYTGHSAIVGRLKRSWQDVDYVLGYFGKRRTGAIKQYLLYIEKGMGQGRRPELVGGGLIRSLGGWEEVKKKRGRERVKGDERILGDSGFVLEVLREAEEGFTRRYHLKSKGYDLDWLEERVCEVCGIGPGKISSGSRERAKAEARALYCYWASRELGYSLTDIAKRVGMSVPGVGYAVRRGEKLADSRGLDVGVI